MRSVLYCSWLSMLIFIGLIIFIPYKVSLLGFKASDAWLILCLIFQYAKGYNARFEFNGRKFLKNFGIVMAFIAIIGTIFQAWHDNLYINPAYFSEFYRFFRYFLLFKFVENILMHSRQKDLQQFFLSFTGLGVLVIFLSFLEFYSVGSMHEIILKFYFIVTDQTFEEYLEEFGRLLGVLGNSNTTGIFITSTLVYPIISLVVIKEKWWLRALSVLYIFLALYVIVVMTSSRTSIIICILLFIFALILLQLKSFFRFAVVTGLSLIIAMIILVRYNPAEILPDRVVYFFQGKNTRGENVGLIESMGRNELWNDRIYTFQKSAHPFASLVGMGYTKKYKDYSDNGLLSSFFNGGLIGLILRLTLYFYVLRIGLLRSFMTYRMTDNSFPLILGLISLVFILWELTADMMEHIKIGQIFYVIFCASVIYGAMLKNRVHAQVRRPVEVAI